MFEQFTSLVAQASGWAYAVVLLFAIVDALIPVVPSETAVITAGVVAADGHLYLPLVIVAAALGAFAGDNLAYGLAHRYGDGIRNRYLSGEKSARRIDWANGQLDARGGQLIAVARFIPGGRTVVTLTAGLTHFPWPRFAVFDAIAALIWAAYAALLGYFGGKAFEGEAWKGLLLALGVALAVTLLTEVIRWLLGRRSSGDADASAQTRS